VQVLSDAAVPEVLSLDDGYFFKLLQRMQQGEDKAFHVLLLSCCVCWSGNM
jgi:hypothetical protein